MAIYATKVAHASEKEKISSGFGARLKALMEERGLTQQQIADAVGVSRAAVGKWQQETIPGARELFILAKFLEKPMESFFDDIPCIDAPAKALHDPPGEVPVSFLSAECRKFYAGMFAMMSTPDGLKAFKQTFAQLFPGTAEAQTVSKETLNQVLTKHSVSVTSAPMKSEIEELLSSARRLTKTRGMKTKLAKAVHAPLPRVSDWLAGHYLPSGERALRLKEWVAGQLKAQQQQSPDSALTPAGLTQKKKHHAKQSSESKPPKP